MPHSIAHAALMVRDYDQAIAFYVDLLGFQLLEDYGKVAVLKDVCSNLWDLLHYNNPPSG